MDKAVLDRFRSIVGESGIIVEKEGLEKYSP